MRDDDGAGRDAVSGGDTRPRRGHRALTAIGSGTVRAFRVAALGAQAAPGALAVLVLVTLTDALLPAGGVLATKWLLDVLQLGSDAPGVPQPLGDRPVLIVVGLAVMTLAGALMSHVSQYVNGRIRRAVTLLVTSRLFTTVARLSGLRHFEDPAFRDRLSMAQTSASDAPDEVIDSLFGSVRGVITIATTLGVLVMISPVVAVLVVVAAVPGLIVQLVLNRERADVLWRVSPRSRRLAFYQDLMMHPVAAAEVRIFGAGRFLTGRMNRELRAINAAEERLDRKAFLAHAPLMVAGAVVSGGGLVWVVLGALRGDFTAGDVSAFVGATGAVQGAAAGLVMCLARIHSTLLLVAHYDDVLATPQDLIAPAAPVPARPLEHEIRLEDVWFRYTDDGPWVLRGVSMTIPVRGSVAVVGLNGAGKSTLVKLLMRMYDPSRGMILWDGTDIRGYDVDGLRSRVSAVFQDFVQYELSARENIALGALEHLDDDARVHAAARAAGADRIVAGLQHGYDTMLSRAFWNDDEVGDDTTSVGTTLSGGQWQRLALARSLMRSGRDLLVLDEPTSGLDPQAENEVRELLGTLRTGTATLLVSHRLGAVRDAQQIVVLAGGVVAEQGTHDELMRAGGEYARLFTLQATGYQDPVPAGEGVSA
ncbi:ABC transporter ATP-binding protein [Promicromonospora sp. NPDC060204]|uniref:ABC transporter ATP-binding protein n=1 Tax=Promicromonospora sp. NPDC060204 TaxID=3347071 RepID=UPI003663C799